MMQRKVKQPSETTAKHQSHLQCLWNICHLWSFRCIIKCHFEFTGIFSLSVSNKKKAFLWLTKFTTLTKHEHRHSFRLNIAILSMNNSEYNEVQLFRLISDQLFWLGFCLFRIDSCENDYVFNIEDFTFHSLLLIDGFLSEDEQKNSKRNHEKRPMTIVNFLFHWLVFSHY